MTTEEAIKILDDGNWWDYLDCYIPKETRMELIDALDIADVALRAQQEQENQKPMTNADRIRTMSDEEMEQFINHFNICDIRTSEECKMSYCACCEVCVMDWLQQPAKEEWPWKITI